MPENERISVVIPCFNAARYIEGSILSVLAQDWPDLDIVVVDDGSSDGSAELIGSRFPGVNVLQQANQGVAAARNRGISAARGDWIAFLDADDIWLPGKLKAQVDLLRTNAGSRMCYTAWQVWTSTDPVPTQEYLDTLQKLSTDRERWAGPSGWMYHHLLQDCVVWTSTVLAERSLLSDVGGFDPNLPIGEDYDLWLRVSRVTPILRVTEPYALYRMHAASITRSVPAENYAGLVISRALAKWGYSSPDGSTAEKSKVDRSLARSWTDLAGACYRARDYTRARQAALMGVRTCLWDLAGWKVLFKTAATALGYGK